MSVQSFAEEMIVVVDECFEADGCFEDFLVLDFVALCFGEAADANEPVEPVTKSALRATKIANFRKAVLLNAPPLPQCATRIHDIGTRILLQ